LSLTKAMKVESSTKINYTTTETSSLILVFASDYTGKIRLDGTPSANAVNGVITIENVPAGAHVITRDTSTNLYYIETVYDEAMAASDINKTQVRLYPNPVSDYLKIDTADAKIQNVKVYNFAGSLVKTIDNAKADSIDLRTLATGNYIISITTDKGTVTKKIIKK